MDIKREYRRFFEDKELEGSGFEFPCDKDGNIIVEELTETLKSSLMMCKRSSNYIDRGVRTYETQVRTCPCNSGKHCWEEKDARGISIGYVCEDCINKKKNQYRKEIFTNPNYQTVEVI